MLCAHVCPKITLRIYTTCMSTVHFGSSCPRRLCLSKPVLAASLAISSASYEVIWPVCACVKVLQRLQRIECLAEQISAAQAGKGPEQESSLPLNALNHAADRVHPHLCHSRMQYALTFELHLQQSAQHSPNPQKLQQTFLLVCLI